MRVLQLLLVVLLGALLVQYTLAAATPKAADAKAPSTPEAPKPVKADPPKAEAPKPAAPKEAPKPAAEPPKAEAPKEVPKPKEAPKAEAPKETPKAEAPKETPKPAAPKETPKAETPKETPKEAPKAEAPKEVPKAEAPKAEAPKEAPKPAAPKETPKEAPKAETPKEAPKKEAPKTETPKPKTDTPKPKADTPKTEGKAEPSFVDTYYPIVQDYADQAITTASKYAEVASEYAKEIGSQGKALAGDYYVVAEKNLGEYKKAVEDYTYSQSVKTVDQFLDPQHAQIIKKNYLNWYGVGVVVASIVGAFMFIRHLTWVLSLTALRAYLSAVSLGVYGTLATLTFLTLRDPADSIKDASKVHFFQTVGLYLAIGTTALSALSLVALPGKLYTFIVLVLSSGLFVDQLELRPTLEKAVGAIPPYSLETLVFLLQTILIFDSVARLGKTKTVTTTKKTEKVVSGGPAPVYIKQEGEIKTEKGSKKGSKAAK